MYKNATELYRAMTEAIGIACRAVTDDTSPAQQMMREATPWQTFILDDPAQNVPACRRADLRWALAYTLHFFANTEQANTLTRYNKHAAKYVHNGVLDGAYGKIAMPQILTCIELLSQHPDTRRAIVQMGSLADGTNQNRPACWTSLHFMQVDRALSMGVFQRSLSLNVMPYDLVLLTNILRYVSYALELPMGKLHWIVGNLHAPTKPELDADRDVVTSIMLPYAWLDSSDLCMQALESPQLASLKQPFKGWLMSNEEVRS